MGQMSATVLDVAKSASLASQTAFSARDKASQGAAVVHRAVSGITEARDKAASLTRDMEVIHPLVRARMEIFFREQRACRAAVAETPLLLEAGWGGARDVDVVVGVACAPDVRRARLANRGWSPELMAEVDGWQWTEERKLARCQQVVDNSGNLDALDVGAGHLLAALADGRRATAKERYARLVARGYAAPVAAAVTEEDP